uniref:Uncharacterized protein n=1 Tax=Siphoviridae sp. ctYh54 TaxID=2826379 RepID=A0A8S5MEF0_9CAUD|nr:MAG TPA: hypothetical protein [Siphoviridae sp. ctYh54]
MSDKNWKNEAISIDVHDVVRYNTGYLAILKFNAKGTTWYVPLPAERSAIDASLKGQKLVQQISR